MQFYLSLTSPFARKVRVALHEKGLEASFSPCVVDPWQDDPALLAVNPLLQVPALRLDDGLALTNSDTILAWLERTHPAPSLWPADASQRNRAEAIAALAQGMIEYAVFLVLEGRRPAGQQSATMIERRRAGIQRAVAALESRFPCRTDGFHLDAIGVACALAYLDFRHPQLDWRRDAANLAAWMEWAAQRPSMQATQPPAA
jgi:glutathione S-transferase